VAARLGNTVAVCKKAYVHPHVLELATSGPADGSQPVASPRTGLSKAEADLLSFLKGLDRVRRRS